MPHKVGDKVNVSVHGEVWLHGFEVVEVHDPKKTRYNITVKNINTGHLHGYAHWEVRHELS